MTSFRKYLLPKSSGRAFVFFLLFALLAQSNWTQAGSKDDPLLYKLQVDQFEWRDTDTENAVVLEGEAWVGHDLKKIWLSTELEQEDGKTEEAELQLLYGQALTPYWDLKVGLRQDFEPSSGRSWGVIGFQGLAPYFLEVDTALFIGERGESAFRFEVEYELLFTQKLILSPELELNFYGQNDAELGLGSGLSDMELGLRLRYEIQREFAPYVGISWGKRFGNSADFALEEGHDTEDWQWVLGLRWWY